MFTNVLCLLHPIRTIDINDAFLYLIYNIHFNIINYSIFLNLLFLYSNIHFNTFYKLSIILKLLSEHLNVQQEN